MQTQISDEMLGYRQRNNQLEDSVRDLEIQISHFQAKLIEADNRVSDSEESLAQLRNELGSTQSECLRLKRANDGLSEELFRDQSVKTRLSEDKLKLENEILNLKIFNQKIQSEQQTI